MGMFSFDINMILPCENVLQKVHNVQQFALD